MKHQNQRPPGGGGRDDDEAVLDGQRPRKSNRRRGQVQFAFVTPARPKGKKDMGDKARARAVIPYLKHRGQPIPVCAMKLIERLIDACNYENGACFRGQNRLIAECQMGLSSVKKARAVLSAAGLVQWTSVENSPYREVIWSDQRVNCYQINWPALNAIYHDLKAKRDAYEASSRRQSERVASATLSSEERVASATYERVASATTNLERGTLKLENLESGYAARAWERMRDGEKQELGRQRVEECRRLRKERGEA